ncbi:MAG: hypothetical protein HC815_35730 [Richelia sp. RM1_1_1]|nr:hypothetical protein [Richelia sp. RM1_1_1]
MKIGQFITLKAIPVLAASISIYSSSTFAQSQTNLPTRMISSEGDKQVLIPDWQRISFNNMPPIQEKWFNKKLTDYFVNGMRGILQTDT